MKHSSKIMLDEDFLSVFQPFYIINSVFCARKYNIKYYNVVEKINITNVICSVLINSLMICFYCSVMTFSRFGFEFRLAYHFVYFLYLFNYVAICVINMYYSSKSVRLLFTLNQINKCLKSKRDLRRLKIVSWAFTALLWLNSASLVIFKLVCDLNWSFMRGLFVSISSLLDMEIIRIIITVKMLTGQIKIWNTHIENIRFSNVNEEEVIVDIESLLEEMFDASNSVHEAWDLLKRTSGIIILLHFITTFIQTLFYAEILIMWLKTHFGIIDLMIISHAVGMILLLSKAFFVETELCIACEKLYSSVSTANTNVNLKISQDLPSKKMWKNTYRMMHEHFEKLSACGVFVVDAATLAHFCKLVTTYVIVLLQFAFL